MLLQKENKIKVLEAKLGVPGGVSVTINEPARQPESKMKQIGKITKAHDAEKQVVDSIRKKPMLFGNDIQASNISESTPVSKKEELKRPLRPPMPPALPASLPKSLS